MLLLLLGWARAQTLDTQGPDPLVLPEAFAQPLRLMSAASPAAGAWSAAVGLRAAGASLTEFVDDGGAALTTRELVGPAFDAQVGGSYAFTDRLVLSAALPFRLASGGEEGGGGLGDARVSGGIGLLPAGGPFRLRVSPWVRLPTGSRARYLGAGGFRFGGSLAAGTDLGPVVTTVELGADWRPEGLLAGGPGWRVGAGGRLPLGQALAVGLEADGFGSMTRKGLGIGSELRLVVGGRLGRVWAQAGGGPAPIGRRPGTALVAGELVAGFEGGSREAPVARLPTVQLHVVDPSGRLVRGAEVHLDSLVLAQTDSNGVVEVDRDTWRGDLAIRAGGLANVALPTRFPSGDLTIELPYLPTPLRVRVTDPVGNPVEARAVLKRIDEPAEAPLRWEAPFFLAQLEPGEWMLHVEADGKGAQERRITVGERRIRPMVVEVILLDEAGAGTLAMEVVDAGGKKVEAARVQLNGIPVGTTGSAGSMWVHGLEGESRSVTVRSEDYAESVIDIDLSPELDATPATVDVDYLPGTVRIIASGPDGPISDGLVAISGPTALPAMPLGEDGERLVVLDPGAWNVALSSVTLGIQERAVEITPDSPNPLLAQFVLQRDRAGEADLVVRVQDRDGRPVEGASIRLDGEALGETSSGGTLRLRGMQAGERRVEVTHPAIRASSHVLDASAGVEEELVVVDWRPDVLRVTATAAGLPVDAVVVLDGAAQIGPEPLGPRGQRYFDGLAAGPWVVTASNADFGIQSRTVDVVAPAAGLPEAVIRYAGVEGGRATLIVEAVDADGKPVVGAPVVLDGLPVGNTGSDGTATLEELAPGNRALQACGAPWREAQRTAWARNDRETRVKLVCAWDVGATRLTVTNGGAPVADALLWLSGPEELAPRALDASGTQLLALVPGAWTATLSHPEAGILEVPFEVSAQARLNTVAVDMQGTEPEPSMLVRVRTPRGRAVANAAVLVDGVERGVTNSGGVAVVSGLAAESVRLEVRSADHHPDTPRAVALRDGRTEKVVELEPLPAKLSVTVRTPEGTPLDAHVEIVGETRLPGLAVTGGKAEREVPPGEWQVFARAAGRAAQSLDITIDEGTREVVFELPPARVKRVGNELKAESIQFQTGASAIDTRYECARRGRRPDARRGRHPPHRGPGPHRQRGLGRANMEPPQRRAEEVRAALVELRCAQSRVVARGFGPTHPIADNDSGRVAPRTAACVAVIVEAAPASEAR
ncbi:MAG: hypothetical protein H6737_21085 [Alphaproteobacteria bacterium]|nr:hypothetical protein [Alphaproteobacteria bacterium]